MPAHETYEDVARAAQARKEQLRAYVQAKVDKDAAVTFLDEGPVEVPVAPQLEATPAPESDLLPAEAVEAADRSDIEVPKSYEEEVASLKSVDDEDRPSENDNKGEWVAYRIKTNNLTEDEANEYTKKELIALG